MIKNLSHEAFSPYGTLLTYTDKKDDGWEIRVEAQSEGWRIALLEFTRKTAKRLEYHPASKETFEPISGVTLLIVALPHSPNDQEVFLLDQPICLEPGIWHEVITLSDLSYVKITENLHVDCVYHMLDKEIGVGIITG